MSNDILRAMAIYEHLTRFVMPLCSAIPARALPDEAVTKIVCIVDISNISIRQVWSVRSYIQDIGKLFAVNYPEVLGKVFVGFLSSQADGKRLIIGCVRSLELPHIFPRYGLGLKNGSMRALLPS